MKQINFFKIFLLILSLGATLSYAQTQHPLSFGYIGTDSSNFYKNYVGIRFELTYPISSARDINYNEANNSAADGWTHMTGVTTPIINDTVIMGPAGDTIASTAFAPGSMTGKIAVIWRGTTEFGQKALYAQNAGAIACIIVNNVPNQGPLGMSAGTFGSTVTIPTFMIGNADGIAISAAYAAGPVTLTISPWGLGNGNDLGFVPKGFAQWHDYAIPANQLMTAGEHPAYDGLDGAFIANYGTGTMNNVLLKSTVSYTPTGGTATAIDSGSELLEIFPAIDSVYAVYEPTEYHVSSSITGTGTVTVNYSISSTEADQYPGDNTANYSYYITDSIYSKSRFDFANNHPLAAIYEAPGATTDPFYLWGPVYYVANGGTSVKNIMWTMASNSDTSGPISSISTMYVCVFKWVDGSNLVITGNVPDSIMVNGELDLVGLGVKNFTGAAADTSNGYFSVAIGDSVGDTTDAPRLDSNGWYFVAPELPVSSTGTGTWFLGCDGINSYFPRTYGRFNFQNYREYSSTIWAGGEESGANLLTDPANALDEMPTVIFGGSSVIDSVIYSTQRDALMPSVAMIANNHPAAIPNGVKPLNPAFAKLELFPNPATDYIRISLGLIAPAKEVTYTVINTSAKVISTVVHKNVQNETYTYTTNNLPSGNYYMIIAADGKDMFKKFTVIR